MKGRLQWFAKGRWAVMTWSVFAVSVRAQARHVIPIIGPSGCGQRALAKQGSECDMNRRHRSPSAASTYKPTLRWRYVTAVAVVVIALSACASGTTSVSAEVKAIEEKARTAVALYQERCKTAGVKIHKTVENVEGVFVMKRRPETHDFATRLAVDPYGRDFPGDAFLTSLLKGSYESGVGNYAAASSTTPPPARGYYFVDAIDPKDGQRYRYTGAVKDVVRTRPPMSTRAGETFTATEFVLERQPATGLAPRYGITYDDIATPQEKAHWVAASSLRVIDLETGEVLAERLGAMVDPGQGNTLAGRAPWLVAAQHACPAFSLPEDPRTPPANAQRRQTQRFVEQVLKPMGVRQ